MACNLKLDNIPSFKSIHRIVPSSIPIRSSINSQAHSNQFIALSTKRFISSASRRSQQQLTASSSLIAFRQFGTYKTRPEPLSLQLSSPSSFAKRNINTPSASFKTTDNKDKIKMNGHSNGHSNGDVLGQFPDLQALLGANQKWSKSVNASEPDFLPELSKGQVSKLRCCTLFMSSFLTYTCFC